MYTLTAYSGIPSPSGDITQQTSTTFPTLEQAQAGKSDMIASVGLTHVDGDQYRLKAADWVVAITVE